MTYQINFSEVHPLENGDITLLCEYEDLGIYILFSELVVGILFDLWLRAPEPEHFL